MYTNVLNHSIHNRSVRSADRIPYPNMNGVTLVSTLPSSDRFMMNQHQKAQPVQFGEIEPDKEAIQARFNELILNLKPDDEHPEKSFTMGESPDGSEVDLPIPGSGILLKIKMAQSDPLPVFEPIPDPMPTPSRLRVVDGQHTYPSNRYPCLEGLEIEPDYTLVFKIGDTAELTLHLPDNYEATYLTK